jgi:hypothetical protein
MGWWPRAREAIMFFGGLAGLGYLFATDSENYLLLGVSLALLGVIPWLRVNEWLTRRNGNGNGNGKRSPVV